MAQNTTTAAAEASHTAEIAQGGAHNVNTETQA